MGEPARRMTMTVGEFLAWDDGTDTRYELVNGEIVAMAPPSEAHGTIAGNCWGEIDRRLERRPPCRAIVEAGIRLDDYNHYKADVAASGREPEGAPYVEEPFLIVEVLAESTADHDLGGKVRRYIELPSVREIWLVDSRERWMQVWRRDADCWIVTMPLRGAAGFSSEALGDRIELDRLYRNTGL
ncbi:Uma2 family endonuclease [Benzoatithermus flavus]|uniref:Uma2 family endonuclease n=1 Tax=Benzoatithermus flavus TaxID=3108223 RepID=A0ABU8XKZ0_9PROT